MEDWLELWLVIVRLRQWIVLAGAIALGPFVEIGMSRELFRGSFALLVLMWAIIVPLLTLVAGRLQFLVWQVAVLSITLAVIVSGLQDHSLRQSEGFTVAYSFWAGGTLFSSPLPIYLFLRRLTLRQRYIFGILIVVVGAVLWFGLKSITG